MGGGKTPAEIGVMWIKWELMQRLLTDMDTVGGQIEDVATYATDEVFNSTAFEYEIQEVARSIASKKPSALLGGELARDAIVLCHKQTEAVKSGKTVKI